MVVNPVAIIIPVHNSGRFLQIALDCIINRTRHPYKIILIESESTDGTAEICDSYANDYENIDCFHTRKEGLIKAINYGILMAKDMDVYLTQDDVLHPRLFERDWLDEMAKLSKYPDCGAVVSINAGGISGKDYVEGMPWFGTWSVYIPRSTINKIGLLDENYSPGCGDDIDYTYRIFQAGLKVYQADFWVDHHRATQHFIESEELKTNHAKYFRQKFKIGEFK
jgi:glycosyltransferase involved in cell wall biosynthesis